LIRRYAAIRAAAARVAQAANSTTDAFVTGRVEQEPAFTERMLGRIEQAMDGFERHGVQWRAKTLTDRGRGSQERRFGADFMGVLNIRLEDYVLDKGFLVQAKLIEPTATMSRAELARMSQQCEIMLSMSPDSFVFLYARQGISVVPAISVVAAIGARNPHELYSRSVSRFFEEHFESFVGDRRLSAPDIKSLESIRLAFAARSLLNLSLTEAT
jgi:hypothetical protein